MSEPISSNNNEPVAAQIDADQEREVAEWFRQTQPAIPSLDFETLDHSATKLSQGRISMALRMTVPVAAAAALVAFVLFSKPAQVDAYVSFADMQETLTKVKTISYRQRTIAIKNQTDNKAKDPEVERVLVSAPNTIRVEMAGGRHVLLDWKRGRSMVVEPDKKRVLQFEGMANITPQMKQMNLYDFLRNIEAEAVGKLPMKNIDGKSHPGFRVERKIDHPMKEEKLTVKMNVWIDRETKLPARIEELRPLSDDPKNLRVAVVMDQFEFDKPLDKELFAFDPPKGYKLESYGAEKLLPPEKDEDRQRPVLTPKVGIGAVKFGMLKDEVIKKFGKPEKTIPVGKSESLEYYSRGVGMMVSDVLGVVTISVTSQTFSAIRVRPFAGKTDKGIEINSTEEAVRKAYGEPSRVEDRTKEGGPRTLYYDDLNGWFSLWKGKVDSMFFSIPRETKVKLFKERKPKDASE